MATATTTTTAQAIAAMAVPRTNTGQSVGLLGPLLDSFSHVMLLLALPEDYRTKENIAGALAQAATHLDRDHLIHPPFPSANATTLLDNLHRLGAGLAADYSDPNKIKDTDEQLRTTLFDIADRFRGTCTALDIELAGIKEAKTGTDL